MARSLKKGPFVDFKLEKRVLDSQESKKKTVIKTWSRRSMITPDFVGVTVAVHNGNKFIPVYVTEMLCARFWLLQASALNSFSMSSLML